MTPDTTDELGYADALEELEAILASLADDDIDVDVLATRVSRAAELIRVCRARVDAARMEVTEIVDGFDEQSPHEDETAAPGDA